MNVVKKAVKNLSFVLNKYCRPKNTSPKFSNVNKITYGM